MSLLLWDIWHSAQSLNIQFNRNTKRMITMMAKLLGWVCWIISGYFTFFRGGIIFRFVHHHGDLAGGQHFTYWDCFCTHLWSKNCNKKKLKFSNFKIILSRVAVVFLCHGLVWLPSLWSSTSQPWSLLCAISMFSVLSVESSVWSLGSTLLSVFGHSGKLYIYIFGTI